MWPNPQFSASLVTFTEEIFNKKLHIFCSRKLAMQLSMFITIQKHVMNVFKYNGGDTIAILVKQKEILRTLSNIFDGVFTNNWNKVFTSRLSKFCGRHSFKNFKRYGLFNRPYPFRFLKGCLPQNLLTPLFNTLPQLLMDFSR